MGGQEDGQALLEGRLTLLLTAGHPHQLQILSMSKLVDCRIKIRELFANFYKNFGKAKARDAPVLSGLINIRYRPYS